MNDKYQHLAEEILSLANVTINGKNAWDIQVNDSRFFQRAITEGELGLGESYMDGWWDAPQLDEFINSVLSMRLDEKIRRAWSTVQKLSLAKAANLQSRRRAFLIGERHYDLGNELFLNMLDKRMNYSCAYWENVNMLDDAQEKKLELICRKLDLQPGMPRARGASPLRSASDETVLQVEVHPQWVSPGRGMGLRPRS